MLAKRETPNFITLSAQNGKLGIQNSVGSTGSIDVSGTLLTLNFRMKSKDVEVIPWYTADAVSCKRSGAPLTQKPASLRVEPKKTVFVGGLHGMMSASLLRKMMKDLFGPVKYVVIDTDKNRYPIGSGRVCFSENQGYQKAIDAEFVEVKVCTITLQHYLTPLEFYQL